MMLLCISDGQCDAGAYYLTIGKYYYAYEKTINSNGFVQYLIVNDIGYKHNIEGYLFKELSEIRKEKLKRICNECR